MRRAMSRARGVLLLAAAATVALGSGCASPDPRAAAARRAATPSGPPASSPAIAGADIAAPPDSLIPDDALGRAIRRGRALLLATRDSLPRHVGNDLRCTSCHLDEGRRASSGTWVGVYASFPQYNKRGGRVFRIEDRINECFRRSLAGTALPLDSREMADMVAYFAFLSRGVPQGTHPAWLGMKRLAPRTPDPRAGAALFASTCARCHGPEGRGTATAPPVWGPRSFAIGAGMARLHTAAAFIRWNMPFDRPGTLTDQQAYDIAAFVLAHPRPDTPGKERDYPNGGAPEDTPYRVVAAARRDAP